MLLTFVDMCLSVILGADQFTQTLIDLCVFGVINVLFAYPDKHIQNLHE